MIVVAPSKEHLPIRPNWSCSVCDADWPCAAAKVELAEEYVNDRVALIIYMATCQWEAIDDAMLNRGGIKRVNALRERFIGWTSALEGGRDHNAT